MINILNRTPAVPTTRPNAPAEPVRRPVVEETVTLLGTAATTAVIGGVCAALAPVGGGGLHAFAGVAMGAVVAGVGGGLAGSWAVSKVCDFAAKLGNISHSQDEKIINPIMGFVTGGLAGLGSAAAFSAFGVSALGASAVCGGAVLAIGGLIALASRLNK